MKKKISLESATRKLIMEYFIAMSNFYGIIPIRIAIEIITEQNPEISEKDVTGLAKEIAKLKYQDYGEHFFILNPNEFYEDRNEDDDFLEYEIIEESILEGGDDDEEYYKLIEAQDNKPYFVPSKEELLKYTDGLYFEKSPETEAFKEYLAEHTKPFSPNYTFDNILEEFVLCHRINSTLDFSFELQDLLDKIEPKNRKEEEFTDDFMKGFMELFKDLMNSTRIWANRGYTPNELRNLLNLIGK